MSLSPEEFVAECLDSFPEDWKYYSGVDEVLSACEIYAGNGCADQLSGDVEAPTGHFYRCNRWIVQTDSIGSRWLVTYDSEEEAIADFEKLDDEYSKWNDDGADYFQGQ